MTRWSRALVTGASSGIGAEMARQLAGDGTDLVLVARSTGALEALATGLRDAHGVAVEVVTADLTAYEQLLRVEERLRSDDDAVDLLVNNAGVTVSGAFGRRDADRHEALLRLNTVAPLRLAHAAATRMRRDGHGGILTVASMAAFMPLPGLATYAASKAFLMSFSQALHEELRAGGVHVTALCPGLTPTNLSPLNRAARPDALGVWLPVSRVARAGLDGVSRNRAVVVPGVLMRTGATVVGALPSGAVRRMVALGGRAAARATTVRSRRMGHDD